jgi:hypothetical protein
MVSPRAITDRAADGLGEGGGSPGMVMSDSGTAR